MIAEIAQAAAEAAQKAGSATWPAVGLATVAAVGSWLSIIYGTRMAKKNNGKIPRPGEGKKCQEHGEAIARLLKAEENTNSALERIEGKVDQLILTMVGK